MTSASLPTAWSEEAAGVAQGFHLREWVIGWLAVAGFGGQCVDGIGRSDGPGSCRNLGMGVRVILKVLGIWRLAKFGCVWCSRGQLWRREEWPQPPSAAMQAWFSCCSWGLFVFREWKACSAGAQVVVAVSSCSLDC